MVGTKKQVRSEIDRNRMKFVIFGRVTKADLES
jgi:hypothetical protein